MRVGTGQQTPALVKHIFSRAARSVVLDDDASAYSQQQQQQRRQPHSWRRSAGKAANVGPGPQLCGRAGARACGAEQP